MFSFRIIENKVLHLLDSSVGEMLAAKPDGLGLIPETNKVKGKNGLLKVVP